MKQRQMHRRMSLPTGTETLRLRESARQRRIARRLDDLFESWGYVPVETPLVDYFEVYRRLLSERDIRQIYRAVDRQGEILALRSDTTIFLAKQLGLYLSPEELPVRVHYHEQIVRAEEQHDISSNEYQQAGVELVGVPGSDGDGEIIILATEALRSVGVSDAAVHIGSHAVLNAVVESTQVAEEEREALRRTLPTLLQSRMFNDPLFSMIPRAQRRVLSFIGTPVEFETLIAEERDLPDPVQTALGELRRTVQIVEPHFPEIRLDFSELGAHGYYTGIAFSVYLPHSNAAVLRGGRYDRLLVSFGMDAPSVGFSMFPRKLPPETLARSGEAAHDEATLSSRITAGRRVIDPAGRSSTV